MSATNKTTYYELPVFIATDEPKWLTDWNGAMNIIDGAIAEAKTAADNAQTTANANALAISGLSDSVSTISTALSTLTTTVNTLNGTVNTITELIGNGTPTTTDKTIIGAINELKAEIDALAPGGEVDAEDVSYDNTSSGLTATNVQAAIDELANASPAGGADLNLTSSGSATVTASTGTIDSNYTSVKYAHNTDATFGKIYGGLKVSSPSQHSGWADIAVLSGMTFPAISEAYNIDLGFAFVTTSGGLDYVQARLQFKVDGTVSVQTDSIVSGMTSILVSLPPCFYQLKDIGD